MTEIATVRNVYCLPGAASAIVPSMGVEVVEWTAKQVEAAEQRLAADKVLDEMPDASREALLAYLATRPVKSKPAKSRFPRTNGHVPVDTASDPGPELVLLRYERDVSSNA